MEAYVTSKGNHELLLSMNEILAPLYYLEFQEIKKESES